MYEYLPPQLQSFKNPRKGEKICSSSDILDETKCFASIWKGKDMERTLRAFSTCSYGIRPQFFLWIVILQVGCAGKIVPMYQLGSL